MKTRKKIEFRVITDTDREFLFEVYASTRAWEFEYTNWTKADKDDFLRRQFEAQDRAYKMTYLGAVHRIIQLDEIDIGRLYVDRQDQQLLIIDFALLPRYQNQGIGSDILKSLINEAWNGRVPIRLHVEQNSPAVEFYLRHGFQKTHMNGHHFAMEWKMPEQMREI